MMSLVSSEVLSNHRRDVFNFCISERSGQTPPPRFTNLDKTSHLAKIPSIWDFS